MTEPAAPTCPFDEPTGKKLKPTDPCPVCGDLGTFDSEESGSCVSPFWMPVALPINGAQK